VAISRTFSRVRGERADERVREERADAREK